MVTRCWLSSACVGQVMDVVATCWLSSACVCQVMDVVATCWLSSACVGQVMDMVASFWLSCACVGHVMDMVTTFLLSRACVGQRDGSWHNTVLTKKVCPCKYQYSIKNDFSPIREILQLSCPNVVKPIIRMLKVLRDNKEILEPYRIKIDLSVKSEAYMYNYSICTINLQAKPNTEYF